MQRIGGASNLFSNYGHMILLIKDDTIFQQKSITIKCSTYLLIY
jgi:hypothetical protein